MKTTSVINKLAAAGLKARRVPQSNHYSADTNTDRISWIDQGGEAICLKVTRHGAELEPHQTKEIPA